MRFEVLERGDALWRILDRRYLRVEYVLIYGASFARGFLEAEVEHRPGAREAMLRRLNGHLSRITPADPVAMTFEEAVAVIDEVADPRPGRALVNRWEKLAQDRAAASRGWPHESRLEGAIAGRDLEPYDALIDLVDVIDPDGEVYRTERVTRTVRQRIPKGTAIVVRSGGPDAGLYPAQPAQEQP